MRGVSHAQCDGGVRVVSHAQGDGRGVRYVSLSGIVKVMGVLSGLVKSCIDWRSTLIKMGTRKKPVKYSL